MIRGASATAKIFTRRDEPVRGECIQRLEAGDAPDWLVAGAVELFAVGVLDAVKAAEEAADAGADAAGVAVVPCEGYGVGNSPGGGISPLLGELQPARATIASMAPKRWMVFMITLRIS